MGRPFLHGGLRARVSSWPPLRLVRLRCERVSVGVVPSQRFPTPSFGEGSITGWCAISEWMCIASSRSARCSRTGLVRDDGNIGVTPEALRAWADGLRADDQLALEATG